MTQRKDKVMAGARLLQQSIERTRANARDIRESRHAHGMEHRKKMPSVDRYIEQRLNSFSYQADEVLILTTLEKLK